MSSIGERIYHHVLSGTDSVLNGTDWNGALEWIKKQYPYPSEREIAKYGARYIFNWMEETGSIYLDSASEEDNEKCVLVFVVSDCDEHRIRFSRFIEGALQDNSTVSGEIPNDESIHLAEIADGLEQGAIKIRQRLAAQGFAR